jgi:hypothetical protein
LVRVPSRAVTIIPLSVPGGSVPEFTYAGQLPASYAETRDAGGFIVGTVEHGDTRDFGGGEKPEDAPEFWPAPDGRWVPKGTKIAKAWDGVGADMYRQPEAPAEAPDGKPAASAPESAPEAASDAGSAPEAPVTGATASLSGTGA